MAELILTDTDPQITLKDYPNGIFTSEYAKDGTNYGLVFIPVEKFGLFGIGYTGTPAFIVINELTRMSYILKPECYQSRGYLAEKLFPRRYWSEKDIDNVWDLYNETIKFWRAGK